ncbi:ABC transporter permease [Paenibacillus sp. SYP-B4298]|uniref:ABC transporter permease n=1 Tax=Paenibacillus sp. SYP-B4298 TaxID=2996034 RepID=UPI0022DD3046|nr:ABC transporter permease [Paenibacillus sp. SYP-B4298]
MQPTMKDRLQLVGVQSAQADNVSRASMPYWKEVLRRFCGNALAVTGTVLLLLMVIMAIFGPHMTDHDYRTNNLASKNLAPSAEHWFGTDDLGRDVFTRTWEGARISLLIGVSAALIDLAIGVMWGGIAAYRGGRTDEIMMRFADVIYGIPYLLMVILLMVVLGQGLGTMILAMTITGWINMARIVRGQVLSLKNREYVLAARTLGASMPHIMRKHLIPNTIGPILVTMTLTVPTAIFVEAFLSYLGLGLTPPLASWGTMASDGLPALRFYPWRLFFPAFFICVTIFAFNVIGDGLRDALDPKLRK